MDQPAFPKKPNQYERRWGRRADSGICAELRNCLWLEYGAWPGMNVLLISQSIVNAGGESEGTNPLGGSGEKFGLYGILVWQRAPLLGARVD